MEAVSDGHGRRFYQDFSQMEKVHEKIDSKYFG
jgi:hypothetical protein